MRAFLATAIYCVTAFTAADAHNGHHRSRSPAAMLGPGLAHMLESMEKPRDDRLAHFGHRVFAPAPSANGGRR